jgi:hypothetical protein
MSRGSRADDSAVIPDSRRPPGAPAWVTAELLADTIATWQSHYLKPLTDEEALDLVLGVGRLFDALGDADEGAPEVSRSRPGQ